MRAVIDLTGQTFGRLRVIGRSETRSSSGRIMWDCICSCGARVKVPGDALRSHATKSCGCLQRDAASKVGLANTKFFGDEEQHIADVYEGMKKRCYNPTYHNYHNYGARGITICQEWLNDKLSFVRWSKQNGYQRGLSIDRIDNNGPYAPWNCRWVTTSIRHNNTRDNRYITVNGVTKTIAEWARELNLDQFQLYRKSDADVTSIISDKGITNVDK